MKWINRGDGWELWLYGVRIGHVYNLGDEKLWICQVGATEIQSGYSTSDGAKFTLVHTIRGEIRNLHPEWFPAA